jgi:hypothetical protein
MRDEALAMLISARGYCFRLGVRGFRSRNQELDVPPDGDFGMAFRELNRAYVLLRDETIPRSPIQRDGALSARRKRQKRVVEAKNQQNLFNSP